MAPMVMVLPVTVMPDRPNLDRSTTVDGLLSRCFSTGMKVWPPANALASSSAARILAASARLVGFSYAKSYMAKIPMQTLSGRLDDGPEFGACGRHVQMADAVVFQRIDHRIDHGGR